MWFVENEEDEIVRREGCFLIRPDSARLAVMAEALNVHEATGLTPSQLQARVAELEGALRKLLGEHEDTIKGEYEGCSFFPEMIKELDWVREVLNRA